MGSAEAKAVRESNLYEFGGVAKPLLIMVAQLQRPVAVEKGEKPHVNEGWCDATQDYLAAMVGCSEDNVQELLRRFVRDGWLTKEAWGEGRNRYRISDLDAIKARKMEKDSEGCFIRARREKMRRKSAFTNRGTNPPTNPPTTSFEVVENPPTSGHSTTTSPPTCTPTTPVQTDSTRQIALEPSGKLPSTVPADCPLPPGNLPGDVELDFELDGKEPMGRLSKTKTNGGTSVPTDLLATLVTPKAKSKAKPNPAKAPKPPAIPVAPLKAEPQIIPPRRCRFCQAPPVDGEADCEKHVGDI